MGEIVDFSPVAASNTAAVPNGAPEGWAPSSVNNVQREVMARNKREELDTNGSLTLGGGTTAYTLSVYRDTAAAYQGETIKAKVNATNTGAVTVTITPGAAGVVGAGVARGAVAVQRGTLALVAGDWIVGDIVEFTHDGTQYQMNTPPRAVTGTGKDVRDTSPTLVTPVLGAATATSLTFGGGVLSSYVGATNWTPTLVLGVGSVTYSAQFGRYVRIGDSAFCYGRIVVNVATTPSGTLHIGGLPFTIINQSGNEGGVASVQPQSWAASLTTTLLGRLVSNATTVRLFKYSATTGASSDTGADVASGCDLFFSFILPIA